MSYVYVTVSGRNNNCSESGGAAGVRHGGTGGDEVQCAAFCYTSQIAADSHPSVEIRIVID